MIPPVKKGFQPMDFIPKNWATENESYSIFQTRPRAPYAWFSGMRSLLVSQIPEQEIPPLKEGKLRIPPERLY